MKTLMFYRHIMLYRLYSDRNWAGLYRELQICSYFPCSINTICSLRPSQHACCVYVSERAWRLYLPLLEPAGKASLLSVNGTQEEHVQKLRRREEALLSVRALRIMTFISFLQL